MVAVRDTHLKAGFDLHDWMTTVDLPETDKTTLLSVFEYCQHRIEDQSEQQRLSKRSAEMIGILLTLHMDMDTLKSAVLFPLIEPGYLTVEQTKADFSEGIGLLPRAKASIRPITIQFVMIRPTNTESCLEVSNANARSN